MGESGCLPRVCLPEGCLPRVVSTSSRSSGRVRGAQETWNLCGCLLFYDLSSQGWGGMAPSAPLDLLLSTQRSICPGKVSAQEGGLPRGCLPRGLCHMTYPKMHLMLPVCCPCTNWDWITSAAAYIVLGNLTCEAYWDTPSLPSEQNDRCM